MDIIERLKSDDLYIDAIDDAILEIERLRTQNYFYRFFMDYVADMLNVETNKDETRQASDITYKIRELLSELHDAI